MGYELRLTGSPQGDHVTDLCANGALTPVSDWIETLDAGKYPAARAFLSSGSFAGSDRLAVELEEAYQTSPPDDPDVAHTVDRLLDLLGDGYPGETAAIVG